MSEQQCSQNTQCGRLNEQKRGVGTLTHLYTASLQRTTTQHIRHRTAYHGRQETWGFRTASCCTLKAFHHFVAVLPQLTTHVLNTKDQAATVIYFLS